MAEISTSRLKDILQRTVGPTPWYWKTFPAFNSVSGQRFVWTITAAKGRWAIWSLWDWSRKQTNHGSH